MGIAKAAKFISLNLMHALPSIFGFFGRQQTIQLALAAWLCFAMASSCPGTQKQKVIFDCDLAGDVDDAFALALLLASPELEVLGITLDHGNTGGRAKVACRFLYELGLEHIPVHVGRATPSVVGESKELAGESGQFIWGHGFEKLKPREQPADDFIISQLRQRKGEVVLLTVGPVCNMQDILKKDPGALKLARKVVSMFGSFYMGYEVGTPPGAEWNVRADVGAARDFARSGAAITYAGLDTTTFVRLNASNRERLLYRKSPMTDALCGLYTLWSYETYAKPDPTLFDAVAVGMVLWPDLFTSRDAHVTVLDGGFTKVDDSQPPNCQIGVTIRKEEFIKRMMDRLLRQNLMRQP